MIFFVIIKLTCSKLVDDRQNCSAFWVFRFWILTAGTSAGLYWPKGRNLRPKSRNIFFGSLDLTGSRNLRPGIFGDLITSPHDWKHKLKLRVFGPFYPSALGQDQRRTGRACIRVSRPSYIFNNIYSFYTLF